MAGTNDRVMRVRQRVKRLLYPAYEARMVRFLPDDALPKHIGVMLDGNRRWARAVGRDTAHGHRAGAANIEPLLDWCEEFGIEVVTLWLLSTDNLNRPAQELEPLLRIIDEAVQSLADEGRWRLHPVGALDLLPAWMAQRLKDAEDVTREHAELGARLSAHRQLEQRYLRDVRFTLIGGGTSEILKLIIAKEVSA